MICRLRLTRQSWLAEVHTQTTQSPDLDGRFAPPIRKLSVLFLGPDFLMLQFIHSNFCFSSAPSFLLSILRHIIRVYETSTLHSKDDYYLREDGEIPTQVIPNFPILRERAIYTKDCNIQDRKQQKDSCQKDFPSHSKLTPGLADAQTRLFMGSQ